MKEYCALDQKSKEPQLPNGLRKTQNTKGVFLPPGEARPVGGSPRLLGIASAACFGMPLGLACRLVYVPQLLAPARCWCAYSGHLPLGAPTRRVERTSWPNMPVPYNTISLIPQTSTDRLPLVELWGILPVESRKNRHIFRGIIWWNYLVESTEFFRPPACPPAATPPRVPPRALGSGHPAPHRGAPFAARSPCFVVAGQRIRKRIETAPRARFYPFRSLSQASGDSTAQSTNVQANVQGTYFAVANKWHHISPLRRCLGQPRRHLR